ncbi:MAG: hypothetical protein SFY96_11350 [Planctomycetota bacterium]|nr:hypothetical protein [Planctomycetota bacterium]
MKNLLPAITLAVFAGVAAAAPSLDYQASLDGVTWSDSVTATVNSTVKIRAFVRWSDVAAYGFANLNLKITASNWDAGDATTIPNAFDKGGGSSAFRKAPFDAAGNTVRTALSGTTRRWYQLGVSSTSEGYLSLSQWAPTVNPTFSTDNPALVIAFDYTLGSAANRSIEIGSLISRNQQSVPGSEFGFFSSAASNETSFRVSGFVDSAIINVVVPSPNVLAAMSFGMCVVNRRRRQ